MTSDAGEWEYLKTNWRKQKGLSPAIRAKWERYEAAMREKREWQAKQEEQNKQQ